MYYTVMAKITQKEVEKVAGLANLELTEAEKREYASQLSDVVDYIKTLDEVRTDSVEPTSQTTGLTNVQRPDKINPNRVLSVKDATLNAENVHNDYFVVGALLNKEKNKS